MAARANNFTTEEMETLLACLESMKDVLVNITPEYKSVESQKRAWAEIARCVNSVGGLERNGRAMKNKWVDLKYRTKKKVSMLKAEHLTDSGHFSKIGLSDIEKRVLRLMGSKSVAGVSSPISVQITDIRSISDAGESSTPMNDMEQKSVECHYDSDYQNESEPDTPPEVDQLYDSELWMNKEKEKSDKVLSSRERVRRYRLKLKKQQDEEIAHVVKTQKLTYESVRRIEAKASVQVETGKTVLKNQEKIIERLDSVVSLMSEINGHMENFNDNLNVLIQVMAAKSGVQIVESDEI